MRREWQPHEARVPVLMKTEYVGYIHRLRHASRLVVPSQGADEPGLVMRASTTSLTRTSRYSCHEQGVVRTEPPQRRVGPPRFSQPP